ncbi:hypothetical protein M2333_001736 [Sphingobium sp. B11D3B]|uniref:hypothetical protein n=1 Tax=unclassified Sphingobium TaxID=2611147 RepID=UPI0022250324|nr:MULTISPECIES: hypothetical protein [unclassified Sphingobium]MCW2365714.1 hypothetical protein [Sphingobium sp. B7D2B]MCW2388690.1 hypothetical protein [Sphingobium sp. B11D3B]
MDISEAGGRTIAADIETAFNSTDLALLDLARLTTSILETKRTTVIEPARFQKLLDDMSAALSNLVEGRRKMVAVHRALVLIKRESNLAEVDFGCFGIANRAAGKQPVDSERS